MRTAPAWPDRSSYSAVVADPARCFDDAELSAATMARGRRGVLAWSGGRAIVFQAIRADGTSVAVRFLLSPDAAAAERYAALERHLAAHPVESFVRAQWIDAGVRIDEAAFPMLKMDWVSGRPVDQYVAQAVDGGAAGASLGELARAWRHTCQLLTRARIGHGDVHAGNVMVTAGAAGAPALRLVGYDNVWVPGLTVASGEQGHPSFQHPRRVIGGTGPHMDAFPNTLMYLSLRALAAEEALWPEYHRGDDMLLFHRDDLVVLDSPIWPRLAHSPDPVVSELARLARRWLDSPCEQYDDLEQVLAAARPAPGPSQPVWNQWPGRAAAPPAEPAAAAQVWPVRPVPPAAPPAAAPAGTHGGRWLLALVVLVALIVVVVALS